MTKKDYEVVAAAVRNIKKIVLGVGPATIRSVAAAALANEFKKDNKRFDEVKFFDACDSWCNKEDRDFRRKENK